MNVSGRSVRGYNRLAPLYRTLEVCLFQNRLSAARVALLDHIEPPGRAIFLGDGDGRLLAQFCRRYPGCRVVSLDQSSAMLQRQRNRLRRINAEKRVQTICGDARQWTGPDGAFDLLVCCCFLDCFAPRELQRSLPRWIQMVRPGGQVYFVDFVRPAGRWTGVYSDALQWLLHRFFRWQTGLPNRALVDLPALLARVDELELVESASSVDPLLCCQIHRRVGPVPR